MSRALPPGIAPGSAIAELLTKVGVLLEQERYDEAIPLLREAAEVEAENPRIQADLGGLYIEIGRPAEAVAHLQKALSINPRMPLACWRLGIALQATGDIEGAIDVLERAVQMRPRFTDAHFRLALLYREQGRRSDALEAYLIAAEVSEDHGEKLFLEAQARILEGRMKEAESLLRSALEHEPELPTAHGSLGQILAASGRFDEAVEHYEEQLTRSPRAGLCYYDLVRSRKVQAGDEHLVGRIDAALQDPQVDDNNRAVLLLARGKALDDLGRYEEAMKSLDEASALRTRALAIDVTQFEQQVDAIIRLFSVDLVASGASGNTDRTPVLILGMPRSGTTLIEQIISSHPEAAGAGELAFWRKRLQIPLKAGAGALNAQFLSGAATECLGDLRIISKTALRVSDKDPFNFLAVGLIHMVFPQAAIIHCRRNPLDTAISIHQTHFSKMTGIPNGGEDLVRYFRSYQRLMAHWRQVLPEGRMYEVEYERLTYQPHTEIPRLIEHLGLSWDSACLTPHLNSRLVQTPSGWQVRQSINAGSVGRWKRYEPWLGPLAALMPPRPPA